MQMQLTMNTTKTKYMRERGSKTGSPVCLTPLAVDENELEEVDKFVYLGSLVTAENNTRKEMRKRILAGNRAYFGLQKNFPSG